MCSSDLETARAITQFKGERLCFPGLKTLDGDSAHALAMSRCWDCELPSLVTLDHAAASGMLGTAAFSPSNYRLSFGGLKKLEAATANVLRHYQGNELALDGLAAIDAETAKWLSEAKCKSLALRGLTSLTPEGAKALSQFRGDYLLLDGVTSLDMATARALVAFKGKGLRLSGLAMIEADAAKTLWNNPKIEIPARFRK